MKLARVLYDTVNFKGGLDQKTPILSLPSGYARSCVNYEAAELGGYRRVGGYERYDGQLPPSGAVFSVISITSFINIPAIGSIVTGSTSGATGIVLYIGTDYIAYTKATGNFVYGIENIMVGATLIGQTSITYSVIGSKNKAIIKAAAADIYRQSIAPVPGSGACIGGFIFNDIVYAMRTNVAGTAVDMYKESVSGWVNVPFFNELYFTNGGAVSPIEGTTVVQGAISSIVKRVVLETGAWGNNTATGRLIITTPVGSFGAGAATSGTTTLTLTGSQSAITMLPGGKLESELGNFAAGIDTHRLYAVDGVNRAFEFDGNILVPLNTGTTSDSPKHIEIMVGYLFLTFASMVLSCAPGLPYDYTALSGAGNVSVDDLITNIKAMRGAQTNATLLITTRTSIHLMYGTDWANFNAIPMQNGGGALDSTVQLMDDAYLFDSRGITTLQAVQAFGNFQSATLTQNINEFIAQKMSRVSVSSVHRLKGQYRLFFTDGTGLFLTVVNRQVVGAMPIAFNHNAHSIFSGSFTSGIEENFMCTTDGFVMKLDIGTSFDGAQIPAFITLNYNPSRNSRLLKRYRKCALEISSTSYVDIQFSYSLGYGTSEVTQDNAMNYGVLVQGSYWDNFTWDNFTWDDISYVPLELEMRGTGENVSLTFRSSTNYISEYTLNIAIIHYSNRRAKR